jgi:hypothetical protein
MPCPGRARSTRSITPAAPPADYPFAQWQDSGDFAVPAQLRSHYAAAMISPATISEYWAAGGARFLILSAGVPERVPVVDPEGFGHGWKPAGVQPPIELRGPDGFPRFLHMQRLDQARRWQRLEPQLAALRTSSVCAVCGTLRAPYSLPLDGKRSLTLCGSRDCAQAVTVAGGDRVRSVLADDGRSLVEHAAEAIAAKLDSPR